MASLRIRFRKADYLYFGHAKVILGMTKDGRKYKGFHQGLGPCVIEVEWFI